MFGWEYLSMTYSDDKSSLWNSESRYAKHKHPHVLWQSKIHYRSQQSTNETCPEADQYNLQH
jgi:hypothetical protein